MLAVWRASCRVCDACFSRLGDVAVPEPGSAMIEGKNIVRCGGVGGASSDGAVGVVSGTMLCRGSFAGLLLTWYR